MPVEPGSSRWEELKTGIVSDDERNWRLGDAALEIAPMGEDGVRNGSMDRLRQFLAELAEERGHVVSYRTMATYRDVSSAWPPPTRVGGASWKAHQILKAKGKQHLLRPGMTTTQASKAAGHSTRARSPVGRKKTERAIKSAEVVVEQLSDPKVIEEVKAQLVDKKATRQAKSALDLAEKEVKAAMTDREKREAEAERERVRMMEAARKHVSTSMKTWETMIKEVKLAWGLIAAYRQVIDDLPPVISAHKRQLDRELQTLRQQMDWLHYKLHPDDSPTNGDGDKPRPVPKHTVIEASEHKNGKSTAEVRST
jgi:hypothetical protein